MDLTTALTGLTCLALGAAAMGIVSRLHNLRARSISPPLSPATSSERLPDVVAGPTGQHQLALLPVRLELTTHDGPFAEVSRLSLSTNLRTEELAQDTRITAGLQALLHHAPGLVSTVRSANTYFVRFAPAVSRGLSDGTLSMMRAVEGGLRATAIDSTGKIVGNAVLTAPSAAVTGALAVWQIMAVVTAQKFLADINTRLAGIERGILEIKEWDKDEQHGKLDGSLKYMRSMVESLRKHDLTEVDIRIFSDQLETIGREAQQVMAMQDRQVERCMVAFANLKLAGVGLEEHSASSLKAVDDFAQASQPWWLAAQVRGVACQLRAPLPLSREVSLLRVRELRDEMNVQGARREKFITIVNERVPQLRGRFSFDKTDELHQGNLRGAVSELKNRLGAPTSEISVAAKNLETQLTDLIREEARPLELVVTLGADGAPTRVERVVPEVP